MLRKLLLAVLQTLVVIRGIDVRVVNAPRPLSPERAMAVLIAGQSLVHVRTPPILPADTPQTVTVARPHPCPGGCGPFGPFPKYEPTLINPPLRFGIPWNRRK